MDTPEHTKAAVGAEQSPPRTVVGFALSRQTSLERDRGGGAASLARSQLTQELAILIRDGRKAFHSNEGVEEEEDHDDDDTDDDEMSAIDEWEAPMSWASSGAAPASLAGASESSSSSQPIAIPATT